MTLAGNVSANAQKEELDKAQKYVEEKLGELPPEAKKSASGLRDWAKGRRTSYDWDNMEKFTRNVFRRLQNKYKDMFGSKIATEAVAPAAPAANVAPVTADAAFEPKAEAPAPAPVTLDSVGPQPTETIALPPTKPEEQKSESGGGQQRYSVRHGNK